MDLVVKLRELRQRRGLTQLEAARRAAIGMKTLSSYESGSRIEAMKLSHLLRLLHVYGVSPDHFFSVDLEFELAPWTEPESDLAQLVDRIASLPTRSRHTCSRILRSMLRSLEPP